MKNRIKSSSKKAILRSLYIVFFFLGSAQQRAGSGVKLLHDGFFVCLFFCLFGWLVIADDVSVIGNSKGWAGQPTVINQQKRQLTTVSLSIRFDIERVKRFLVSKIRFRK